MAKVHLLTLSSITGLFNSRGMYTVGYGFVYGMCECAPPKVMRISLTYC